MGGQESVLRYMLVKLLEFKGKEYVLSVSRQNDEITSKDKIITWVSESSKQHTNRGTREQHFLKTN